MSDRAIHEGQRSVAVCDFLPMNALDLAWVGKQARGSCLLLAHCDDGVIWGRGAAGAVTLQPGATWRPARVQAVRMFNDEGELLLWRTEDEGGDAGFAGRWITDGAGEACAYYDEDQILWGTSGTAAAPGFTQLEEDLQGLRHVVPMDVPVGTFAQGRHYRPVRLGVRQYLETDAEGMLRVTLSRLTGLSVAASRRDEHGETQA